MLTGPNPVPTLPVWDGLRHSTPAVLGGGGFVPAFLSASLSLSFVTPSLLGRWPASDAAPLVGGYLQTLSVEMVTLPLNLSPLPSCVAEEICDDEIRGRACPAPLLGAGYSWKSGRSCWKRMGLPGKHETNRRQVFPPY